MKVRGLHPNPLPVAAFKLMSNAFEPEKRDHNNDIVLSARIRSNSDEKWHETLLLKWKSDAVTNSARCTTGQGFLGTLLS